MPTTKKILVKPKKRAYSWEDCSYSITSTWLSVPDVGVVVVPWLVLNSDPAGVLKIFQKQQGEIVYDQDSVNVFMTVNGLRPSCTGALDDFSQTWLVEIKTSRDLSDIIHRLTSVPTVVAALARSTSVMQETGDIPFTVILQPKARCIEKIVADLQKIQQKGDQLEKFYFEVDLGASVKRWATEVLKEDLTIRAARFAFANGAPYNHMFDWQNVMCCLPCLPCCLVASGFYRLGRKLQYKQVLEIEDEPMVIVGTESTSPEDQAQAIRSLMAWAKSKRHPMTCRKCGMPRRKCRCESLPPVIVQQAPVDTKETKEVQEYWSSRQALLQATMKSNRLQTLKDIKRFTSSACSPSEDDDVSIDLDSELGDVTSRDVTMSISTASGTTLRSSGTFRVGREEGSGRFRVGGLGIFSLSSNSKVHPTIGTENTKEDRDKLYKADW